MVGISWTSFSLSLPLVRHRVDNVVDTNTNPQRREFFIILRIVGPLPGIAQVGIESHGGYNAAFVIIDASPARRAAFALVRHAGAEIAGAGNLITVVQIINRVENLVGIVDVDVVNEAGQLLAIGRATYATAEG